MRAARSTFREGVGGAIAARPRLFDIPDVGGVFFGSDFISVTKTDGDWQQMKPAILGAIMEHYMSGAALLTPRREASEADGG